MPVQSARKITKPTSSTRWVTGLLFFQHEFCLSDLELAFGKAQFDRQISDHFARFLVRGLP
jgi:hypothetical protein